jgi:hypothetical protein
VPERIQLSRRPGWRMPENTIKVDRSTKWGNPFTNPKRAANQFREWIWGWAPDAIAMRTAARAELRGKNLGCWCAPGAKCHADVLLEIANGE